MVCLGWVQEWSGNGHEGTFWGYGSVLYLVESCSSVVARQQEMSKLVELKICTLHFIVLYTSTEYVNFLIVLKSCVIGTEVIPSVQMRELRQRVVFWLAQWCTVHHKSRKAGWSGWAVRTLAQQLIPCHGLYSSDELIEVPNNKVNHCARLVTAALLISRGLAILFIV